MKIKLFALALALALLLSGCSLAREGEEQDPARFVGAYIVMSDRMEDLMHLGDEIIMGQYDYDTNHYTFPGLEGRSLYVYQDMVNDRENNVTVVACDLTEGNNHIRSTDEGDSYELSGTVYFGAAEGEEYEPYEDSRYMRCYNVYQGADGSVFLRGSSATYNVGMAVTYTRKETSKVTRDGETRELSSSVEVRAQFIPRLEGLVVRQYSGDGMPVVGEEVRLTDPVTAVTWHPEAAWAVVEELRDGEVMRTAYDRPADGDAMDHTVILLDEDGLGYGRTLRLEN